MALSVTRYNNALLFYVNKVSVVTPEAFVISERNQFVYCLRANPNYACVHNIQATRCSNKTSLARYKQNTLMKLFPNYRSFSENLRVRSAYK